MARKKVHKLQQENAAIEKPAQGGMDFFIRYPWLSMTLLAVFFIAAAYVPAMLSPTFITNDDSILRLPLLSHAGNIPIIFSQDFLLFTDGQYRPLSYAILAVIRTMVSSDAILFWHFLLLAVHALNALLVFSVIRRFTPRFSAACFGVLVFCLQPLCTTIVNDINQFHILLGILFCLGSINSYMQFQAGKQGFFYLLSLLCFVLGLFTSRQGITPAIVILLLEILSEPKAFRKSWLYLIPYFLLPAVLFPLLFMSSPHPLHYKYVQMHEGSFWHGFFTFIGSSGIFLKGILLTVSFPCILYENVQQIFQAFNIKFLLWITIHLLLFSSVIYGFFRKQWYCLGLLIVYCSMVPYCSVYINRVVEYVSWTYFYFAAAGLAIFFAGLYDCLFRLTKTNIKHSFQFTLLAILLFWSGRTFQLNLAVSNPFDYWWRVADLGKNSVTSLQKLTQCYFAKGDEPHALHNLFTPYHSDLKEPCLRAARYYCQKGEYLASAIHLRYGSAEGSIGVVLEKQCLAAGELMMAIGAFDHADENFGKVLMVNPYNTEAMCKLAQVWSYKGFIREAQRMLERAQTIFPKEPELDKSKKLIELIKQKNLEGQKNLEVTPPAPDWLDYLIDQKRPPAFRRQIVELSKQVDPNDPIIQLEAMIVMIEDENFKDATRYLTAVNTCLSTFSFASAACCEVLAQNGEFDNAIQVGLRAITLDSKSELAWKKLALAYALKGNGALDPRFSNALERNPALASNFYYSLALYKTSKNNESEALALFGKAIQSEPKNPEIYIEYARSLINCNDPTKALEILQKSLKYKTDNPETYVLTGFSCMSAGKIKQGIEAFRTAIKIDPKNYYTHYYLGYALKEEGLIEESLTEFQRSADLKPDFQKALYQIGIICFQFKNYDKAIPIFEAMLRNDPNLTEGYSKLMAIYTAQGKTAEAQSVLERAKKLGLNPQN